LFVPVLKFTVLKIVRLLLCELFTVAFCICEAVTKQQLEEFRNTVHIHFFQPRTGSQVAPTSQLIVMLFNWHCFSAQLVAAN
jgi:hypothetical protein